MKKELGEPIKTIENCKIYKDFGSFGDGKWQKHLTITSWFDNEPKFDIRPWNDDLSKCGKGIQLDDAEIFDLLGMLEDAINFLG